MGVQISLQDFISFRYAPRSRTAESYGDLISTFLRNIHTVFHHGGISSHSHQQCTMSPFSPHPPQHLFLCLFDNSRSDRCEVIFHCGFLWLVFPWWSVVWRTVFIYLLAICISCLEKRLLRSFAPVFKADYLPFCYCAVCVPYLNNRWPFFPFLLQWPLRFSTPFSVTALLSSLSLPLTLEFLEVRLLPPSLHLSPSSRAHQQPPQR